MALIVGEKIKNFPRFNSSSQTRAKKFMKRAKFDPKMLTPFCNSLKHLLLKCVESQDMELVDNVNNFSFSVVSEDDSEEKTEYFNCQYASHHMSRFFLTFLLRHIPNLQTISEDCNENFEPSRALVIIHTIPSRFQEPSDTMEDVLDTFERISSSERKPALLWYDI